MGHLGLAILVPVLGRPHRVKPLLDSITETTPEPFRVVFICDSSDRQEQEAILADGRADLPIICRTGSYPEKINAAVRYTDEPLVFLGADDIDFRPGWFQAATERMTGDVRVVGVNDLLDRAREHATHFLMAREYAEKPLLDGEPGPLFEGYRHWWCDNELIATARKRGAYAYAENAVVEHLHPIADKAPDDDTYQLGRQHRREDARLFKRRMRRWR